MFQCVWMRCACSYSTLSVGCWTHSLALPCACPSCSGCVRACVGLKLSVWLPCDEGPCRWHQFIEEGLRARVRASGAYMACCCFYQRIATQTHRMCSRTVCAWHGWVLRLVNLIVIVGPWTYSYVVRVQARHWARAFGARAGRAARARNWHH